MLHGTLIITPRAQTDLRDLWRTIAVDDQSAADRLLDQIMQRAASLASFPSAGHARPELGRAMRSLVVDPYVIVYRRIPA